MKNQPRSQYDRIMLASTICWWLSAGMTALFAFQVIKASIDNIAVALVISIVASAAVQYVITMAETALFNGTLPAPWRVNYSEGGPLPWIMFLALSCLLLDVILNLGGVGFIMSKLPDADIGQKQLSMSTAFINIIVVVFTIVFSILCAVGSELLKEFAKYVRDGMPKPKQVEFPRERAEVSNHKSIEQRPLNNTRRIDPRDVRID